ncbi:ComEC/Rec2 family competence protein [Tenacibaculum sp. 190524A05c]|uniref:ComEC/Rec2 family competence protein n=1 Tax=Tenacibaculum platacis TaxID=3137852 RepID=UPI0031FA51BF
MKELRYLPLHILVCVIIGIFAQHYFIIWKFGFDKLYSLLSILLICLFIFHKLKRKWIFILISSFTYTLVGVSSLYISNNNNYKTYFINYIKPNSKLILELKEELKANSYNYRFIGSVISIDNQKTLGKVLINISKDSSHQNLGVGNRLYTISELIEIQPPQNPYDFNYKRYMNLKGVEYQLFLNTKTYRVIKTETHSLLTTIAKLKKGIQLSLQPYFSYNVFGIINSLLLGERKVVSKKLLTDYSNAGAIHILAISGLHVGILVLLLNYLFYPLLFIKYGKSIRFILLILMIWLFAILTGLSSSVVRATTMFSFIVLGKYLNQKQPIENALISSMLLLLICKPTFLFDVGFQLSYIAVLSIVKLQPLLYTIYTPKYSIVDKIWQLTTVSITAQIGVLPLSLYYFHQFPSLFLLSNLIIVPCLGIILLFGILIVILALLKSLPQFLIYFYENIIHLMNSVVSWISSQENFILKEINISFPEVILYYLIIIFLFQFIRNKSVQILLFPLSFVICIQTLYIVDKNKYNSKREFIIFHKNKESIIGNRTRNTLEVYHTKTSNEIKNITSLGNYTLKENIDSLNVNSTKNIIKLKDKLVLVIDSLGIYPKIFSKNSIILLQYSPKLNLNRLIQTIQPQQIIADGSNYKSYIKQWKRTCKKLKTPFHSTKQNGAYIIKY